MIPDWNISGVLPPIRPTKDGIDPDRSPYAVGLPQLVDRFAYSDDRTAILYGLLDYRRALHELGIVQGFQWLDGSFMEVIEHIEGRSPNDVDVVTFFKLPDGETQRSLVEKQPDLFDSNKTKAQYKVDGYYCILGEPTEGHHVNQIAYWYSMWSHKRNGQWKGFLQIDLSPEYDLVAFEYLSQLREGGDKR